MQVEPAAPALELAREEQVGRRPAAVEQEQLADVDAVRERVVERRPQRRQADAAADEDEVASSAASSGQRFPNGPRAPSTAPGSSAQSAFVTAPTARIVCTSRSGCAGSPLDEIGTSPTPKA